MPSRCKQKSGVRSSRGCKTRPARVQYNIDVVKGAQKLQVRDAVYVRFYDDAEGNKPVLAFLEGLRKQDPILHKLVVAGIKKLEMRERHGPPLTRLVDQKYDIFELRIGDKNIAHVFFFFRQGREIILTNGYVKKRQKVDMEELARARTYKYDWEQRHT